MMVKIHICQSQSRHSNLLGTTGSDYENAGLK
jgi:hypothetical protein